MYLLKLEVEKNKCWVTDSYRNLEIKYYKKSYYPSAEPEEFSVCEVNPLQLQSRRN